jgi:hypothetical protein
MSRIASSVLAVLILTAGAALAEDGCSRDVDCKGERICSQHECVEPPPPVYSPVPPDAEPPPVSRSAPAASAPAVNARPPQEHHRGFFIRLDVGLGYLGSGVTQNGTDLTVSGAAGAFSFALGGSVAHNQILAFHLWDLVATEPTFNSAGSSSRSTNTNFGVVGIGPQYTVYSQQNVYLSLTPSLTKVIENAAGLATETDWGFGLRAAVGKEWWVSRNWGLGIAGQFTVSANRDSGTGTPTWTTWGASVAFSATYN